MKELEKIKQLAEQMPDSPEKQKALQAYSNLKTFAVVADSVEEAADINDFGRNSFVTHTIGLKERIEMDEHLFKLKKDGKTVGYLKITDKIWWKINRSWIEIDPQEGCSEFFEDDNGWDTAHPFVTKDKNDKDIFEGDEVRIKPMYLGLCEGIVNWNASHASYQVKALDANFLFDGIESIELIED